MGGLSPDQRALLQLLLERDQSYSDIGSLLGVGEDEVRRRVRAALTEVGGDDPDSEVPLSDWIAGQADPIGRADAIRHLQADPQARETIDDLLSRLRLLFPDAELPSLPDARGRRREPRPAASSAPREPMPRQKVQLLVAIGVGTILALITVVLVVRPFGDDDGATAGTVTVPAPDPVEVPLEARPNAPDGVEGTALFAQVGESQDDRRVVLTIAARNLPATSGDERYVVWLYQSRDLALPLTEGDEVGDDGELQGVLEIPPQFLPVLLQVRYLDVSLEPAPVDAEDGDEVRHRGQSILRGNLADAGPARLDPDSGPVGEGLSDEGVPEGLAEPDGAE